jgi:maleylpyruvate isomerase
MKLTLYHYWRSSSSWRVRWAFAIKGLEARLVPVNLLSEETETPEHRARHPLGFVPALEIEESSGRKRTLCESLAIIEWCEELVPEPRLLPGDALDRARIRMLAEMINSDTHPIQNLSVQAYFSDDPAERKRWASHWITLGLTGYEQAVRETAGRFSFGDSLTLADLCLIPQCYNALRFEVPLGSFPTVERIWKNAHSAPGFEASRPEKFQPLAPA